MPILKLEPTVTVEATQEKYPAAPALWSGGWPTRACGDPRVGLESGGRKGPVMRATFVLFDAGRLAGRRLTAARLTFESEDGDFRLHRVAGEWPKSASPPVDRQPLATFVGPGAHHFLLTELVSAWVTGQQGSHGLCVWAPDSGPASVGGFALETPFANALPDRGRGNPFVTILDCRNRPPVCGAVTVNLRATDNVGLDFAELVIDERHHEAKAFAGLTAEDVAFTLDADALGAGNHRLWARVWSVTGTCAEAHADLAVSR